jgi:hypothetical protein
VAHTQLAQGVNLLGSDLGEEGEGKGNDMTIPVSMYLRGRGWGAEAEELMSVNQLDVEIWFAASQDLKSDRLWAASNSSTIPSAGDIPFSCPPSWASV